jgi:hypothetical protein
MATGKKNKGVYSFSSSKDTAVRRGATTTPMSTLENENENHRLTGAVVNEIAQRVKEEYDLLR